MAHLGVNIDHVATLRQARRTNEPDPVWAAALAELGGADGITIHLREDRRHIQDRDLEILRQTVTVKLNLELAANLSVIEIACRVRPDQATLVPERREEITTEGGLDCAAAKDRVAGTLARLKNAGIRTSLFITPDAASVRAALQLKPDAIEIHTGRYAHAWRTPDEALAEIRQATETARAAGVAVHAGHGLTYENVGAVAAIPGIEELNIGHSVVSRAVLTGMDEAVREMRRRIDRARRGS